MTNSKSAQLFDGLHKWWPDVRESEATKSPVSKDGTLESLKACVEGLKAELHPSFFNFRVGGAVQCHKQPKRLLARRQNVGAFLNPRKQQFF